MLFMPYVKNYEIILKKNEVDYEIINWDRFRLDDENNTIKYRDFKIGQQRNFIDYYRFKKFIVEKLNSVRYEKVIVFGIPLAFFLKEILLQKKYAFNYILDIRDYHKIIRCFNISEVIDCSSFVVLSSPGFKNWLPDNKKYIINHNTAARSLERLTIEPGQIKNKNNISISYIGLIKNYNINIKFIDSLIDSKRMYLYFHGEGMINKDINKYIKLHNINNVLLTGRYNREMEKSLYKKSDLINALIPNDHVNSKTLLPNRLYNAVVHGKPMVAYEGTYLSKTIENNCLGIVLNAFGNVEKRIDNYINTLDVGMYEQGRNKFFDLVMEHNSEFNLVLKNFITK